MARKTGKDYRKELVDIKLQKKALEARIVARAKNLCKKYPDFWMCYGSNVNANKTGDFANAKDLHILSALSLIEFIEKELADSHPHKQTSINF